MKNTNRLLAVLLAVTIAVSGIVITTLTTNAAVAPDTKVYATYNGNTCWTWYSDINAEHRQDDGTFDLNYYEQDLYAPVDVTLEVGKVYKAIYCLTINRVNNFDETKGWEVKAMPTEEYYYNITNADIWDQVGSCKTAIVVPFKVTDPNNVKLKMWTHGALVDGSTLDKVMLVGADYNAYDAGTFDIVKEGVANAGSNVNNNKPADDKWTASFPTGLKATYYQQTGYISNHGNTYKAVFNKLKAPSFNENNEIPGGDVSYSKYFDATIDVLKSISKPVGEKKAGLTTFGQGFGDLGQDDYLIEWTGTINATTAGTYSFVGLEIDNGCVIKVNGTKVYEYWNNGAWFDGSGHRLEGDSFPLNAGENTIEIYYLELGGGQALNFQINDGTADKSFADAGISFALESQTYQAYGFKASWDEFNNIIGVGGGAQSGTFEGNDNYDESIAAIKEIVSSVDTIRVESFIIPNNDAFRTNASRAGCTGNDGILVEYEGYITATEDGTYSFGLTKGDNGCVVEIDGTRVIEYWGRSTYWDNGSSAIYMDNVSVEMKAGESLPIKVVYLELDGGEAFTMTVKKGDGEVNFVDSGMMFSTVKMNGLGEEIPYLSETQDTILANVDFVNTPLNATIGDDIEVENGIATMNNNVITFNSDILSDVTNSLIVEMVIKPTNEGNKNHEVFMSIGDSNTKSADGKAQYAVMGRFESSGKVKLNGFQGTDVLANGEWITVKYVMGTDGSQIYVNDKLYAEGDGVDLANLRGAIKFGQYTVQQWADPSFIGQVSQIRVSTPKAYPATEKIIQTIETNKEVKDSGDNYGMKFENLAAGVYKIAYYMTIDSARDGAQMRISPIVSDEGYSYRCWIDWKTTVEMNGHTGVKTFMEANDTNKVILVSVITVPENGATIDAGFWQDDQAYIGTLDKVALATDGYDFIADTEYTWVDEKGYRGNEPETTFNEDAQQKILAVEGDWTMSTRPYVAPPKDPYVENKFVDADSNADGLNMTDNGGTNVGSTFNGAWLGFEKVDFGTDGAKSVKIDYTGRLNRIMKDATVEIWLDAKSVEEGGVVIGTIATPETSGAADNWNTHATPEVNLEMTVTGEHDIFFVMKGTADGDLKNVANLYTFVFSKDVVDDGGDDKPDTPDKPTIVEGLNGEAWSFDGSEENYKKLFGGLTLGKNGDIVKATVAAGTGLTKIDCQAIVPVDYVIDGDNYVIKYTGVMTVGESGWYQFATNKVDNGYVAYAGGVKVIDCAAWNWWNDAGNKNSYGETVYLEAGVKYSYEAYFVEQGGGQVIIPQVIKADGSVYTYGDAGFKFYANETADEAVPVKWENVDYTFAGISGNNDAGVKENNVIKLPATATGHVWNYTKDGYTKDSVIKVAWYITVDSVANDVDPNGVNIIFDNNFGVEANGTLDIPNSVFTENVGKNIIVVGVFNQPNDWMEGRWNINTAGIGFTVNKVVIGNENTDFDCEAATLGGYTLVFEEANSEDIVFTPSVEAEGDDKPSDKPGTGDVASVVAILVAGAAAVGGIKLKKKSK